MWKYLKKFCDLNPQKTCRFATKLVPKLEPVQECTEVMKETCQLSFTKPKTVKKPLQTKWCLDVSDIAVEEAEKSSNKLVIPNIVLDNDIQTDISNKDSNLNEKKITFETEELSFDTEIVEEHPDGHT